MTEPMHETRQCLATLVRKCGTMQSVKSTAASVVAGVLLGMTTMVGVQAIPENTTHPIARSPKWPAVRRHHLVNHPACEVCGGTKELEVYHVKDFSRNPQLELDPGNLITLCSQRSCKSHLVLGHLGNYQGKPNPHIREDAALLKKRREEVRLQSQGGLK